MRYIRLATVCAGFAFWNPAATDIAGRYRYIRESKREYKMCGYSVSLYVRGEPTLSSGDNIENEGTEEPSNRYTSRPRDTGRLAVPSAYDTGSNRATDTLDIMLYSLGP